MRRSSRSLYTAALLLASAIGASQPAGSQATNAPEPARVVRGRGRIVVAEAFCEHARFAPKLGSTPCKTAGSFLIVRTRSRALLPVRCNHDQAACVEAGHGVGRRVYLRGGMVAGVLFTDHIALDP